MLIYVFDNDPSKRYLKSEFVERNIYVTELEDGTYRIDFNRETIFDIYKIDSGFVAKKAMFKITVSPENKILSVDMDLKGFYVESDSGDQVKYRLEVSIDYDWTKSYSAVTKKEDIDNK